LTTLACLGVTHIDVGDSMAQKPVFANNPTCGSAWPTDSGRKIKIAWRVLKTEMM